MCVCPNPALDITYEVPRLQPGRTHAVQRVHIRAGGKATNAAQVMTRLGERVRLIVPLGGHAGAQFETELADTGIGLTAVPIAAPTRLTVTIADGGRATLFNEPGPVLTAAEWSALLAAVSATVAEATVVLFAGSLPSEVPTAGYAELIDASRRASQAKIVLDAKGESLRRALAARPSLVTPNLDEARSALGDAAAEARPVDCARHLVELGAHCAVVTSGADGLWAATPSAAWHARLPRALTGNPTGAGDAATAALALGLVTGSRPEEVLRDAVATSAAAVLTATGGDVDTTARDRLRALVEVTAAEQPSGDR